MRPRTRKSTAKKTTPAPEQTPAPKRRPGRPPGRDPNRRKAKIDIRCTIEEKELLAQYAADHGLDTTTWIRETMIDLVKRERRREARAAAAE